MTARKNLIALTGPSGFTAECMKMIEDENGLNANFVLLYQNRPEHLEEWLSRCDGVVLAGGVDIHPTCYGESVYNHRGFSKFDITRDVKELFVLDHCFKHKKPFLGICRGHQLLSVYKGIGDFIMDLDGDICHQPHRANITISKNEPLHSIEILEPDIFSVKAPRERKILNAIRHGDVVEDEGWVNSFHHQAVAYRKKYEYEKDFGVLVLATAPTGMDGLPTIIEAMCGSGEDNHWLTVQWHPEYDYEENSYSAWVVNTFRGLLPNRNKETKKE